MDLCRLRNNFLEYNLGNFVSEYLNKEGLVSLASWECMLLRGEERATFSVLPTFLRLPQWLMQGECSAGQKGANLFIFFNLRTMPCWLLGKVLGITLYRRTLFYCTLLYCDLQIAWFVFLQIKGLR